MPTVQGFLTFQQAFAEVFQFVAEGVIGGQIQPLNEGWARSEGSLFISFRLPIPGTDW